MRRSDLIKRVAVAIAATLALVGCSSDNGNNNGGGDGGSLASCTAGASECVTDTVIRTCQSDGTWAAFNCVKGTCVDGACKAKDVTPPPVQICFPGDGACQGNMKLTCTADGTDYTAAACPTGTDCVGAGLCQGVCVIGDSLCLGGDVLTCTDGLGYTANACPAGQACVATGDNSAACKPAGCTPALDDCAFVCGNKLDATADQTKFRSACQETATGFQWTVIPCAGAATCDPVGGDACESGFSAQAGCTMTCTEGQMRCNDDFSGVETCTGGVWISAACPTSLTPGVNKTCVASLGDPTKFACGDFVCLDSAGTCTSDGKFRPCDNSGNLATTPRPCDTGLVCVAAMLPTSAAADAEPAGNCAALCTEGESRCLAGNQGMFEAIQKCVGGVWTAPTACGTGKQCLSAMVTGSLSVGCYTSCVPGQVLCDKTGQIATCTNDGTPGTFAPCAMGVCDVDAGACKIQCVLGDVSCDPATQTNEGFLPARYTSTRTCNAKGVWAPAAKCTNNKQCRYDGGGAYLGCVECVYHNELNMTDSQCTDANEVQTCASDNTWGPKADCGDAKCFASVDAGLPFSCGESESDLNAQGLTCLGVGLGAPISCADPSGTVDDCCASACGYFPAPLSAACLEQ